MIFTAKRHAKQWLRVIKIIQLRRLIIVWSREVQLPNHNSGYASTFQNLAHIHFILKLAMRVRKMGVDMVKHGLGGARELQLSVYIGEFMALQETGPRKTMECKVSK